MVQGVENLRRLHAAIPQRVKAEVTAQLEAEAQKFVQEANGIKPLREIQLGWTWGDAPRGAVTIGRVARNEFERIAITIYATTPQGSGFSAAWFEFGTSERFHKTGKSTGRITASPFFFPTYRANRRRVRAALSRAVSRGFKKA